MAQSWVPMELPKLGSNSWAPQKPQGVGEEPVLGVHGPHLGQGCQVLSFGHLSQMQPLHVAEELRMSPQMDSGRGWEAKGKVGGEL